MQDRQPEILVAGVLLAEVEFERFAEAVQGVGARVHFSAFDALDGTRADFTQFSQALLRQSFLLAQFSDFESEIRLVHGLLLSGFNAHYRNRTQNHNGVRATFTRHLPFGTRHFIQATFSTMRRKSILCTQKAFIVTFGMMAM